jgi:UDP-N-acetylmuramoylalanine--D-glutamate ligase
MQKKIGILGFGVVGKSVLKFFQNKQMCDGTIDVWDQKSFDPETQKDLADKGVQAFDAATQTLEAFVAAHDSIIPSPGVNLNDFYKHKSKFVCELDIFNTYFKKPTIAITGSLGKTTTTKLLGKLAAEISFVGNLKKIKPFVGGNVGLGMLEAIEQQNAFDLGVLEISSFQLEFSKSFAPNIAIFTNCYPNHLDRHRTLQNYISAKLNLIRTQTQDQYAILSEQLLAGDSVDFLKNELQNIKSQLCFTFTKKPDLEIFKTLDSSIAKLFYRQNNILIYQYLATGTEQIIFDLSVLPEVTFIENWIQVITTLFLLGADMLALQEYFKQNTNEFEIDDHHHRVEHFTTINGVDFFDDSKATVIQSTLAATKRLAERGPVLLILGGLGKGVDRSPLCQELDKISNLKKVYCYGPECKDFEAIACKFSTLEEIVVDIKQIMRSGDQVILSPSGTSFDFYKNYKQRGQVFKDLVKSLG